MVKVNLSTISPVAETMGAFREVSSAQEDKERIIVNAQRLLVSLTPQAHGNADYEVQQALGEAHRRVKTAGAEADAIRRVAAAVRSAPNVLQNMLWREKLEIALSHNSKIIVPNKSSLEKVALWKRRAAPTGVGARHRGSERDGRGMGHGGAGHGQKNGDEGKSDKSARNTGHGEKSRSEKQSVKSASNTGDGQKNGEKNTPVESAGNAGHGEGSGNESKPMSSAGNAGHGEKKGDESKSVKSGGEKR